MGLQLITAPTQEPLSLPRAKLHIKVEPTDEDDNELISDFIRASRFWAEDYTHRKLVTQTWDLTFNQFPNGAGMFELPFGNSQQVVRIQYIDSAGATQTLTGPSTSPAGTDWQEDLSSDNGAIVAPPYNGSWPTARDSTPGAVTVRFVTGYGEPNAIPEALVSALLFKLSDLYDVRGIADMAVPQFPAIPSGKLLATAEAIALPFVLRRFS